MKSCLICNDPTNGSIGAAGIDWPAICQNCKDTEDAALSRRIEKQARVTDRILFAVLGSRRVVRQWLPDE